MRSEKTTKYISVSLSPPEVKHLEEVVAASGLTRNRYLRTLIAKQKPEPPKGTKLV